MDFLKLNNLLEHMEFHKSTYDDDLFSFISKHYGDKMEEHKEQKDSRRDHQKLPFNHSVCVDSGQLILFETNIVKMEFSVTPDTKRSFFNYYNFYSFLENTDIFQPPRIA